MSSEFLHLIANSDKPVLADFWAEWCGPCRMMAPVLHDLAKEWKGKAVVVKVDTDAHPDLSGQFGISGIPTLILFQGGREVHRVSGAMPLAAVKAQFGRWVG